MRGARAESIRGALFPPNLILLPSLSLRAVLGFHIHFEGDPPHTNASQWAVKCIPVSKTQRFMDQGVATKFWRVVDEEITVRKPHMAPKD